MKSVPNLPSKKVGFDTRQEAEQALASLREWLDYFTIATLGDLYEVLELDPPDYAEDYGWMNLKSAYVLKDGRFFYLELPNPLYLRNDKQ